MLMHRKKLDKWTRWFAIGMAILFAFSGIFIGVGSNVGDVFSGCSKSSTGSIDANSSLEDRETYFKNQISQNPADTDSMLALANLYGGQGVGRYDDAIVYYNQYLVLVPNNVNVMMLIGKTYAEKGDYASAVKAFGDVTKIDPTNSEAFRKLAEVAEANGQNAVAIMALNKYLELNPAISNAQQVKDRIAKLAALPAVTTSQTTTVPGSPETTAVPVSPAPVATP